MNELRLVGLIRVSGCCRARVAHMHGLTAALEGNARENALYCVDCGELVREHWLENCLGEVVWRGFGKLEDVEDVPRLKRSRRKPTEAEPPSYRLILPMRRG